MVFLAGPRRVGKTTLARKLLGKGPGYLNWDIPAHRSSILAGELPPSDFWIFDEIHKYRKWRNYLKELYDEWGDTKKILVTGSARLDHYRFGGDSLQGRYHFYRLHQFSAAKQLRAVKKEQKHYHYDWTVVTDPGKRFENMVAMHLLKRVHYKEDTEGSDVALRYFRDIDGRETDFVVEENGSPRILIEAKLGDAEIGRGMKYLKARFPKAEAWQISLNGAKDYLSKEGIRVRPAIILLSGLT